MSSSTPQDFEGGPPTEEDHKDILFARDTKAARKNKQAISHEYTELDQEIQPDQERTKSWLKRAS